MKKSKNELQAYGLKMLQRGDTFRAVSDFVNKNCDDPQVVADVLIFLTKRKNLPDTNHLQKPNKISAINIILGMCLLVGGIIMLILFWNRGYIIVLPFALIGAGMLAMLREIN